MKSENQETSGQELEATFVDLLKQAMDRRGWNQKQLSEKADISVSTVNEIIKSRKFYSLSTWTKIANAFDQSLPDFLGISKPNDNQNPMSLSKTVYRCVMLLQEIEDMDRIELSRLLGRIEATADHLKYARGHWNKNDRRGGRDRRA